MIEVRYDSACYNQDTCGVLFNVHEKIPGPVYLYIHYKDFFANHRNVANSVSKKQLSGTDIQTDSDELSNCSDIQKNKDNPSVTKSISGDTLVDDEAISPCGIFASLIPKDGFTLTLKDSSSDPSSLTAQSADTNIVITTDKGLVWDGLKGNKYKKQDNADSKSWYDVESRKI